MAADTPPITVVLVSDCSLLSDGLDALLDQRDDVRVVGRASEYTELSSIVDKFTPDAAVITMRTPAPTATATIEATRRLRVEHPGLGIVFVSDRADGFAVELLRGGASRVAYLVNQDLPTVDVIISALHEVCSGQTVLDPRIVDSLIRRHDRVAVGDLTQRETDVLELIARGLSNTAIAFELSVSPKAVEKYITVIFRKLGLAGHDGVDRRVTAALTFLRAQSSPLVTLGHGDVSDPPHPGPAGDAAVREGRLPI